MGKRVRRMQRVSLLSVLACVTLLSPLFIAGARSLVAQRFLPVVIHLWQEPTPTPPAERVLITEVLYDPTGLEPGGEWIELTNVGSLTADLRDLKLGDEEERGGGEGMYIFPPGVSLAPDQALLIANQGAAFRQTYGTAPDFELRETDPAIPNLIKYTGWAGGNVELVNSGDEVLLLDRDDSLLDAVSWAGSAFAFYPPVLSVAEGWSIERRPGWADTDTAADWQANSQPSPWLLDKSTATLAPTPTRATQTLTPTPIDSLPPTTVGTPGPPTQLLISEVLYNPLGVDGPDGEWVEVYNPSLYAVGLEQVRLGDEEFSGGGEGMAYFPLGSWVPSGGTVVVANRASDFRRAYGFSPDFEFSNSDPDVPDMLPDRGWATGSVNLSDSGDELLLLGPGNILLDSLSWGSSDWAFNPSAILVGEGHSLERYPPYLDTDTAADWREQVIANPGYVDPPPTPTPSPTHTETPSTPAGPTLTLTPTFTPTEPGTPLLLLSEVFYDAAGIDELGEWIELYNSGNGALTLSSYKLGDEESRGGSEGMYRFPQDSIIAPGQVILIARQAASFKSLYGFSPDYEILNTDPGVPDLSPYPEWSIGNLALSNEGDEVLVLDGMDLLVDALSWGNSTWAFNPSAPVVQEGQSLERYPPGMDTDSASDWRIQGSPSPGQVDLTPPTSTPTSSPTPSATPVPSILINEIHADPHSSEGDANGDGVVSPVGDEFLEFANFGLNPMDLSGWSLEVGGARRHIFPSGSVVPAGCAILLFGGGAPQGGFGGSVVQVSDGWLSLDNTGDQIRLLDDQGTQVISFIYGVEASHDQAIVRSPDITGSDLFVLHSTAPGSGGALFSPGTLVDGGLFSGCSLP